MSSCGALFRRSFTSPCARSQRMHAALRSAGASAGCPPDAEEPPMLMASRLHPRASEAPGVEATGGFC
eukprot:8473155-Alexandrium_andersonii.AAC.1